MPITLFPFKCSNGHSFEANAKLRTRCPECGVMTKRSFVPATVTKPEEPKPEIPKPEPKSELKTEPVVKTEPQRPVLIRKGRERMPTRTTKPKEKPLPAKKTLVGSKVAGGLVSTKTVRTRGVVPGIKGRPKKTAVARGSVAGHETRKPFWHGVAEKFGI